MKPPSGSYHTLALLLLSGAAGAAPRPKLTAEAQAILAKGPALLLPADDLLVPLPTGKPVRLIDPPPGRLELVDREFLVIEDELYRLDKGKLHRVAAPVGRETAVTPDGTWVVSVEDKRTLKLQHGEEPSRRIEWRHDGQWELERPFLAPDGSFVLVALREYGRPLDSYSFLLFPTAGGTPEEVSLGKNFVPGLVRQQIAPGRIALQIFTQHVGDDGQVALSESDPVVFDVKTKKMDRAPADLRLGVPSSSGKLVLFTPHREEHKCGDQESRVYEADKKAPFVFRAGPGKAVQLVDFLPDESGVIAAVIDATTCKTRGVVIPLTGDAPPSSWKPFPLPAREGRIMGRVVR